MVGETSTPTKQEPSLADNATRLNNSVSNYLANMVSMSPNLTQDAVLTTGHRYDDTSKVFQEISALRTKLETLSQDPFFGAQAKTILAELNGSVNAQGVRDKHGLVHSAHDQITALMTGKLDAEGKMIAGTFNPATWEKSFKNINDSIALATEVASKNDPTDSVELTVSKTKFVAALKDVSSDLSNIQKDAMNADLTRLNESVQRLSIVQHSEMVSKELYGNNWQRRQFKRIDNPAPSVEEKALLNPNPGADFSMASLDQSLVGLGQDGYYRQEKSDYIIRMENGSLSAIYSPVNQTVGETFSRMNERFKKHRADDKDDPFIKVGQKYDFGKQYAATVEALKQLTNVDIIVFDYKKPEEFSKFHAENIENAMRQALAGLQKSAADGSKPIGFELGSGAMAGLMQCRDVPNSHREQLLKMQADINHEYERQAQALAAKTPKAPQATNDQESVLKATAATPQTNDGTKGGAVADNDVPPLNLEDVKLAGVDKPTGGVQAESTGQAVPKDEKKPEQTAENKGPQQDAKQAQTAENKEEKKPEQTAENKGSAEEVKQAQAAENKGPESEPLHSEAKKVRIAVNTEEEPTRPIAAIMADAEKIYQELVDFEMNLPNTDDKSRGGYGYIEDPDEAAKLQSEITHLEEKLNGLAEELKEHMPEVTQKASEVYTKACDRFDVINDMLDETKSSLDDSLTQTSASSYSVRPNQG